MKIAPLTKKRLLESLELLRKVFPSKQDKELYEYWLPKSIEQVKTYKYNLGYVKYWIGIENNKVIGITGLYCFSKNIYWLGWFCVNPKYRNKGLGSMLLDFTIKKAKEKHAKKFRIWTFDEPSAAKGQLLYNKRGFKTYKKVKNKRYGYTDVYKELKL